MYEVKLDPPAEIFFAQAQRPLAKKLSRCFRRLEQDPRRGNMIKPLHGRAGQWRYRVGDWRVIYRIDDASKLVHVIDIDHRREVYDR